MSDVPETILVIDDEADTVELCKRLLKDDYRLIVATDAREALELAQGQDIAVALVDQRMPHMTGLEFFREFVKTHPRTGRVVITGYTELDDIVALINDGKIEGFVLKPWNNHQLRLTVAREVDNYRKVRTIDELNKRLQREHSDMMAILQEIDPKFEVPRSNNDLKESKTRMKNRVALEVERLFLENLFERKDGPIAEVARDAKINRTFLYRLLKRHNLTGPLREAEEASPKEGQPTA